ncbi:MAG TPA: NfeD family protein [Bryobacteraceae bacterium]|nr:NfeD family protein [Bryobacteraceae bacterium]
MLFSALIIVALLLLALEIKFGTYGAAAILGAVLLSLGILGLMQGFHYWHPALPIALSIALAIIATFQGYLGFRVRKEKRLAGAEELLGQTAVTRTPVEKRGTVMIRGEYWQATSDHPIPAGADVRIQRVEGLLLHVKET